MKGRVKCAEKLFRKGGECAVLIIKRNVEDHQERFVKTCLNSIGRE
jgi:hypothetical protein